MAEVIKAAPTHNNIGRSFNGKTVQSYTVDLQADASDELGPNGAIQEVLRTLALRATPVLTGILTAGDTTFTYYVEGEFGEDDYNDDGTPVTFASHLQTTVQALGATAAIRDAATAAVTGETVSAGGFDLSAATVVASEVFQASQVNA
jgi:hypothetical protein